jgi:hypothetical protein
MYVDHERKVAILLNHKTWTQTIRSLDDYLYKIETNSLVGFDFVSPQSEWIGENTIVLNFDDFENEIKRLFIAFGVEINEIPKVNYTNSKEYKLTEEQIRRVKALYRKDYER